MSAVVLRCPNCGTTRATPGECEACHSAQVRYFCTNHTPGRWLESPACAQCGARFGEPQRSAPAPASAAPRRAPPAPPAPSLTAAPVSPDDDEVSAPRHEVPTRRMPPTARPELEAVPIARGLGCLVRFILIMAVLVFALVSALFLFGGSLLQVLLTY